ncbi:MAG: class B sortase [Coriobacteriales bacterium]|jgi:sortase B|nr:class B sortase [Coriobacteriales bacterium]
MPLIPEVETPPERTSQRRPDSRTDIIVNRALIVSGIILLLVSAAIGGWLLFRSLEAQTRNLDIQMVSGLTVLMEGSVIDPSLKLEDLQVIDWAALRERNSEVIGWVIIPGTHVNYPIVQGPDNDYYLYHLFDDTSNDTGTVFADYQGSPTLAGQNNLVYGHNMRDGSMFSDLIKYTTQSYLMEHQTVFLATPERNYELRAIATLKLDESAPVRVFSFESDDHFASFRDNEMLVYGVCKVVDLETARDSITSLYSFVTCDSNDSSVRYALCATPVRSLAPGEGA